MEELTNMIENINIQKPDDILLQLIEFDFNCLVTLVINKETIFILESTALHDYYLNETNSKIIYDYLSYNNTGYDLLKNKIYNNINVKRFNLIISDLDIQTYVDYYLESLINN